MIHTPPYPTRRRSLWAQPSLRLSGGLLLAALALVASLAQRHPTQAIAFSLQPDAARPRQSFAVVGTIHNLWLTSRLDRALSIVDSNGLPLLKTRETFAIAHGIVGLTTSGSSTSAADLRLGNHIRELLAKEAGFMYATDFNYLSAYGTQPQVYLQDPSCPTGLASGRTPPPLATSTTTFVVLPSTPPGTYTVRIPSEVFCSYPHWDPRKDYRNPQTDLVLRVI